MPLYYFTFYSNAVDKSEISVARFGDFAPDLVIFIDLSRFFSMHFWLFFLSIKPPLPLTAKKLKKNNLFHRVQKMPRNTFR